MPQIIDLRNIESKKQASKPISKTVIKEEPNMDIQDTRSILLSINPGKAVYSIEDTAKVLNMGYEFVRRRIQNGKIKCVYFGDRQMINIDEIARIIKYGV